jgi:hypothetical protein
LLRYTPLSVGPKLLEQRFQVPSDQRFCLGEFLISPLFSLSRRLALPGNVVRT